MHKKYNKDYNLESFVQLIYAENLTKISRKPCKSTSDREESRKRDDRRAARAAYIIVVVLETICTHASRTYLSWDARDRESRTQP